MPLLAVEHTTGAISVASGFQGFQSFIIKGAVRLNSLVNDKTASSVFTLEQLVIINLGPPLFDGGFAEIYEVI
jgi:hypothetical protein